MKDDDKFRDIIAKAITNIDEASFRELLADGIKNAIEKYDVSSMISRAVEVVAKDAIRAETAKPEVLDIIQKKVADAILRCKVNIESARY